MDPLMRMRIVLGRHQLMHFSFTEMDFNASLNHALSSDGQVIVEAEGASMCSLVSRATRDGSQPAKQSYYQVRADI